MENVMKRSNLVLPEGFVELDREEMTYVDGGGSFRLSISCTVGGAVAGFTSGVITGFVTGLVSGLFTKLGTIGGWAGAIIMGVIGAAAGSIVSSVVNKVLYGNSNQPIMVINFWIPFFKLNYDIDIGEKMASLIGGFGGGIGGAAAASIGYACGLAY